MNFGTSTNLVNLEFVVLGFQSNHEHVKLEKGNILSQEQTTKI